MGQYERCRCLRCAHTRRQDSGMRLTVRSHPLCAIAAPERSVLLLATPAKERATSSEAVYKISCVTPDSYRERQKASPIKTHRCGTYCAALHTLRALWPLPLRGRGLVSSAAAGRLLPADHCRLPVSARQGLGHGPIAIFAWLI